MPPSASAQPQAPEQFDALVDSAFEAFFAFSPSRATAAGIHTYDAKLGDRSRARIEARIGELESLLARLRAQERSELGFDQAIDAQALEAQLAAEHLLLSKERSWEKNPISRCG